MGKIIHDIDKYKNTYDKHKHLGYAAAELGIKWQNLYYHLSKAGHPVTGDKEQYGSSSDKFAHKAEELFQKLVPSATDMNEGKFQAKVDFKIGDTYVDVKASSKKDGYKNNPRKKAAYRWAFSCTVQENLADYMVCFCYEGSSCEETGDVEYILLIPKEFYKNKQSFSVSCRKSKWYDFQVTQKELTEFFEDM